jgi:hypothetical protein
MTKYREYDGNKPSKKHDKGVSNTHSWGTGVYTPCHHSHPTLHFGKGKITGTSCHTPGITDADIYVGLDHNMQQTSRRFPWEPGFQVHYAITDMQAPSNTATYLDMIHWLCEQLLVGQSIHVGCFGGHGRTGLVLTSILAELWHDAVEDQKETPDSNPLAFMFSLPDQDLLTDHQFIQWMRKHHCKKAVESYTQIEFLQKHFEAKKAPPIKGFEGTKSGTGAKSLTVQPGSSLKNSVWDAKTKSWVKDATAAVTSFGEQIKDAFTPTSYPSTETSKKPSEWAKSYAHKPHLQPVMPVSSAKNIWAIEKEEEEDSGNDASPETNLPWEVEDVHPSY